MNRVVVAGAGPAGLMAAGILLQAGCSVAIVDPNGLSLKKLSISGKGRCNLTNDCDVSGLFENIPQNPRFLQGAFSRFDARHTMAFFASLGVPLKTERGGRVFPVSNKAEDIAVALRRFASGAEVFRTAARAVEIQNGAVSAVKTEEGRLACNRAILATGGFSYPGTGSTGDGFRISKALGHTVIAPRPSLVPLTAGESCCAAMQGLSLKNTGVTVLESDKPIYKEQGELLFTHFGVSGPVILSASSHMRKIGEKPYRIVLDLKPALSPETLDRRILRDWETNTNRHYKNSLDGLLPKKMIPVIVRQSGISEDEKIHSVTREERLRLVHLLKAFSLTVTGTRPISEAIVTSGGVSVKEISPKTMESKLVKGLYFAGELIDVDAYTGGYNLQIAWSTGYVAGHSAAGITD